LILWDIWVHCLKAIIITRALRCGMKKIYYSLIREWTPETQENNCLRKTTCTDIYPGKHIAWSRPEWRGPRLVWWKNKWGIGCDYTNSWTSSQTAGWRRFRCCTITSRIQAKSFSQKIDREVEARLIALSCSDPPPGRARWSLRLLAERIVELGYLDSISHEAVRQTLKKTNWSPSVMIPW